jgi:short subunit dehydrogenase-like uncharacterized protein
VAGRVVLFGATGYTGRLAAEAMVARGMSPLLVGRNAGRLEALARELGGDLETAVADVSDPAGIGALLGRGDVIVSTVGPFLKYGQAAVAAATQAGAHYIDSTGEPPFIREVFERHHVAARDSGSGLVTAFGYDFVPGNLAGALALRDAGDQAVRVDVGYYNTGRAKPSGGTQASLVGVMLEPAFAWRDGRIQSERSAKRYRTFDVNGHERPAVSVGGSEHFGLPRLAPQLREVNAYLGWFGPGSRPMQGLSAAGSVAVKVPGVAKAWESLGSRLAKGSTGGPDAEARARSGSHIVGAAYDDAGRQLSEVHLTGVDGYTLTGRTLAWGAERAAAGELRGVGALGPVDGFGLDELRQGCEDAGLHAEGGEARAAAPDRAGESAPLT